MNLCDVCVRNYGECMNDHENQPRVVYDNNEDTGDAVVDCDWYMLPRKEQCKKEVKR